MKNIGNITNITDITNITNITKSMDNVSYIFNTYKNIIFQYVEYNNLYVHLGNDINVSDVVYLLYASFIWSIILSTFIVLNTKYICISKHKYIFIDILSIIGSLIGFMIYGFYFYTTLNIISGIILNFLYLSLVKNKIISIHIVNYILYTSFATAVLTVGTFILNNHFSHLIMKN
jgi:hypothetical protein